MVDRHREGNELKEVFKVLGSVGNVYTVTISHVPSCDCPDALKVLRVVAESAWLRGTDVRTTFPSRAITASTLCASIVSFTG